MTVSTDPGGGPSAAVAGIGAAAATLLDALGDRAGEATFAFDDPHRTSWTYLPGERPGMATAALDRPAGRALHRLLAATVSPHTHAQITAIMGLEDPLAASQGGDRHVGDYWVALYGAPDGDRWAWRLGGHHVSVRATVAGDDLRVTPLFLGANPARIVHDGVLTSQPLGPEEVLGFRLLAALPERLRREAVVAAEPPEDIVTGDAPMLDALPPVAGVRFADLPPEANRLAERLVAVYLSRLAPTLRPLHERLLPETWGDLRIAWAGATDAPDGPHGPGHYYRIQGPRFLAELDDTQNRGNHVHTVWRDPDGDHGADL